MGMQHTWRHSGRAASREALAQEPPRATRIQPEFRIRAKNHSFSQKIQAEPPKPAKGLGLNVRRLNLNVRANSATRLATNHMGRAWEDNVAQKIEKN